MNLIRPIQGLRGLAVILVILFHLNPNFSFGFIGVDIFFVISGFVITKSLIKSRKINKKLSITNFYIKRFLRLYPSLIFFFIFSTLIIITLSIPTNIGNFIRTGFFALFGVSNFYLIKLKNDYFNDEELNPFTHTWSLGIEEQFYLIFPFLIFFINKKKLNHLLFLLFFFSFNLFLFTSHEIYGNFFFTLIRVWELILGSLLYIYLPKIDKINKGNYFYLIIFLSFLSIFLIDSIKFKIIFSTLFSFFIIAGYKTKFVNFFFSNFIIYKIGEISYSLYLFHLPIIYISRLYLDSVDFYIFSILSIFIISYINYKIIENPFRKNIKLRFFIRDNIKSIIFVILIMMPIMISNENYKKIIFFDTYFENKINKINYPIKNFKFISNVEKNDLLCENKVDYNYLINNCYKKKGSSELIYLFGDSRAWHIKNIFSDIKDDYIHHYLANSSFDYPLFDKKNKSTTKVFENIEKLSKDYSKITLIISFHHNLSKERYESKYDKNDYFEVQFNNYDYWIKNLPSNVNLIFLQDTPTPPYSYKDCLNEKFIKISIFSKQNKSFNCNYSFTQFKKKNYELNNLMMNLSKIVKVKIVSINDMICKDDTCSFFYENFPIIYDKIHFNKKYLEKNKDKIVEKILINM